jgi:hypothetical protein
LFLIGKEGAAVKRLVAPIVALIALFGLGGTAFAATTVDAAKTPGATDVAVSETTLTTTVCAPAPAYSRLDAATKKRVFAEYHIKKKQQRKYVIDRLVPLELGGTNDLSNLWPQTRSSAAAKNATELSVRGDLCAHKVDLATAQQAFASDWTTAGQVVKAKADANAAAIAQFVQAQEQAQKAAAIAAYVQAQEQARLAAEQAAAEAAAQQAQQQAQQQAAACPNGTYVNSAGNTVCSPYASSSAPAGATAQCRDGTYSFSQSRSGTCSGHGGVAQWL